MEGYWGVMTFMVIYALINFYTPQLSQYDSSNNAVFILEE